MIVIYLDDGKDDIYYLITDHQEFFIDEDIDIDESLIYDKYEIVLNKCLTNKYYFHTKIFIDSCKYGYIQYMKYIKSLNLIYKYDKGLCIASKYGQLSAMEMCRKWGAKNYEAALISASSKGQLSSMKLLKEWINLYTHPSHLCRPSGCSGCFKGYNSAFIEASIKNQIEAMILIREWGKLSLNYEDAILIASKYTCTYEAVLQLNEWIDNKYEIELFC